jgi:hypothetical protein
MRSRDQIRNLEVKHPEFIRKLRRVRWWLSGSAAKSRSRLSELKDRHSGERCFIIGNGPSLNHMDMSFLKDEFTFSLNRGYLYYDRIGGACTYHVAVNTHVLQQWSEEIIALPNMKFIPWGARRSYLGAGNTVFLPGALHPEPPRFSLDPRFDLWAGATVTYVALQLAYFLGFKQVILIGVDHRFKTQGPPHQEVRAGKVDEDHFDPSYFSDGVKWQLPDLATSELAYHLARHTYAMAGRTINDATVDGALKVFPKIEYTSLFS